MGQKFEDKKVKMFFFILYGMSIFTLFNIIISVYFFISLKDKRGPPGPKGKKGMLGDRGDHGECINNNRDCLKKSLETIIVDTLESKFLENKVEQLKAFEKILICNYVKQIDETNFQDIIKFFQNDSDVETYQLPAASSAAKGKSIEKIAKLKEALETQAQSITDDNTRQKNSSNFLHNLLRNHVSLHIIGKDLTTDADFKLDSDNC